MILDGRCVQHLHRNRLAEDCSVRMFCDEGRYPTKGTGARPPSSTTFKPFKGGAEGIVCEVKWIDPFVRPRPEEECGAEVGKWGLCIAEQMDRCQRPLTTIEMLRLLQPSQKQNRA
jgi:hypothetical protein